MPYKDKEKQREYVRKWKERNKEHVKEYNHNFWKEWYKENKETKREKINEWFEENEEKRNKWLEERSNDGHYSVYLLPKENYVGQTKQIRRRLVSHKWLGRDISDYKILHTFSTREEALEKEAEYHSKGYEG